LIKIIKDKWEGIISMINKYLYVICIVLFASFILSACKSNSSSPIPDVALLEKPISTPTKEPDRAKTPIPINIPQTEKPTENPAQEPDAMTTTPPIKIGYPENFHSIGGEYVDIKAVEPEVLSSREGAHGVVRHLDYGDIEVYEIGGEWRTDIAYKDKKFVTSEGISVGNTRLETLKAYEKYGITGIIEGFPHEYPGSELDRCLANFNDIPKDEGGYRWFVFLKNLADKGYTVSADKLLYVDNGTDEGVEQFGGLGAWIFVFDDADELIMIISTAPTAG